MFARDRGDPSRSMQDVEAPGVPAPSLITTLSLTVSGIFGGRLTESPCEADYGDIGGIQTVNCRLAASVLAPEETLKYLMNAAPNRLSLSLSFSGSF